MLMRITMKSVSLLPLHPPTRCAQVHTHSSFQGVRQDMSPKDGNNMEALKAKIF